MKARAERLTARALGSAGAVGVQVPGERRSLAARERATVAVYACAIFAGAGLVFLVQPMLAKMVLPLFGGSPSVWTTSMVFFQAVLLAGYA